MQTTVGEFGNGYYQQSVNAFNSRDFKKAAELFELTYQAQKVFAPKADTALLNNAAISLLQARDFAGVKELYKRLIDMDYTGIETIYEATDALTGERLCLQLERGHGHAGKTQTRIRSRGSGRAE